MEEEPSSSRDVRLPNTGWGAGCYGSTKHNIYLDMMNQDIAFMHENPT